MGKAKAVDICVKPKPPPYKPPVKDEYASGTSDDYDSNYADSYADNAYTPPEPAEVASEEAPAVDPDDAAFEEKFTELTNQKKKAVQDEDYDLADEVKEKLASLKEQESARVK